jgi:hypothetical protein
MHPARTVSAQSSTEHDQLASLPNTLNPAKIDGGDGRYTLSTWFARIVGTMTTAI